MAEKFDRIEESGRTVCFAERVVIFLCRSLRSENLLIFGNWNLLIFLDFVVVGRPACLLPGCTGLVSCSHRTAFGVHSMAPTVVVIWLLWFPTLSRTLAKSNVLVLGGVTDVPSVVMRRSRLQSFHFSRMKHIVRLDHIRVTRASVQGAMHRYAIISIVTTV